MGECAHERVAQVGRCTAAVAEADPAVAGMVVDTVLARCGGCGELTARSRLRSGRSGPVWETRPAVLTRGGEHRG